METTPWLFVGNDPALDFLNTRMISGGKLVDRFQSWGDVLDWLAAAELLRPGQVARLAGGPGGERARGLRRARELREAVRDLVGSRRVRRTPNLHALAVLNRYLAGRPAIRELAFGRGKYRLEERRSVHTAEAALEPVAEAAAHLLCHAAPTRVRPCGGTGCVLWFLDTSKNGRRRWCSMAACGNRTKAAAFYRRSRAR